MRNLSIKNKLVTIIFGITISTMVLGFGFIVYQESELLKDGLTSSISVDARLIAEYLESSVNFGYQETADEILSEIESLPDVTNALVFDKNNKLFVRYDKEEFNDKIEIPDVESKIEFIGNYLHVYQKISFENGVKTGTLYLRATTQNLYNEIFSTLFQLSIYIVALLTLAYFASVRFQKVISGPILELSNATKIISDKADYSISVEKKSNDEIGVLCDGFNEMIKAINLREKEIEKFVKALKGSEEKFRTITENVNAGIFRISAGEKRFLEVNIAFSNMFGTENRLSFLSKNFEEIFFDGRETKNFLNLISRFKNVESKEYLLKKETGESFTGLLSAVPVYNEEGKIIHYDGFISDLTERKKYEFEKKRLEEQLYQSQKMESIGRLAGGIAHDFNNVLTGIMGYAELLKVRFPDVDSPEGKATDVIISGTERAANLTKQLLGFARGGKYNPVPLDVNEVLKDSLKVIEKIFKKNIDIKYDLYPKLDLVEADRYQLDQVFTNIIINANDSMEGEGTIFFSTSNVTFDESYKTKFPDCLPGRYVKISISDTGMGIPDDIKDRIFEPFFSTKGEGKGTGLGLATVYGIVKNHRGELDVESKLGVGTKFNIYLATTGKSLEAETVRKDIEKGDSTILVVDDEKDIRELAKDLLTSLGYKVITASDGVESIDIYKQSKSSIDLVILDMIMPGMDGKETFRNLKKIKRDIKVVIASGYSKSEIAMDVMDEGVVGFIQKPFKRDLISNVITEVLKK